MKNAAKKIGFTIGLFFILLIAYSSWRVYDRYEYFGKEGAHRRKAIGVVVDIAVGGKLASKFKYQFKVDNQEIINKAPLPDNLSMQTKSELEKYLGKRYFVIYSVEKPKYSELLIEKGAIKNTSLTAPDTGWLENESIPNYPVRVEY